MATIVCYAQDPTIAMVRSEGVTPSIPPYTTQSWSTVRAGYGLTASTAYPYITVGTGVATGTASVYHALEAFMQFDTSAIQAVGTVEGAVLELMQYDYSGSPGAKMQTVEIRLRDWGGSLDTGDWVPGANLGTLTHVATWTGGIVGSYTQVTNHAINANINKLGYTRYLLHTPQLRTGTQPISNSGDYRELVGNGTPGTPVMTIVYGAANAGTISAAIPFATFSATGTRNNAPPFSAAILTEPPVISATGTISWLIGGTIFPEIPVIKGSGFVLTDHSFQSLDEALLPVHYPTYRIRIKWNGIDWVDETTHFRSAGGVSDVNRETRLQNIDQANFELDNTSHRFSPTNTASPLYNYLNGLNQKVSIEIGWEGVYDEFFYGDLTLIKPDVRAGTVQMTALSFADRFSKAETYLEPAANLLTSEVARRLLVNAGFKEGIDFALEAGQVMVQYAVAPAGSKLLEELLYLVQVENGRLFFDPEHEGRLTLQNALTTAAAAGAPAAFISTNDHIYDLEREVSPQGMANTLTFEWLYREVGDDPIGSYDPNAAPLWSNYTPGVNAVQELTVVATPGEGMRNGGEYGLSFQVGRYAASAVGIPYNASGNDISYKFGYGLIWTEQVSWPGKPADPNRPPPYDKPGKPNTYVYLMTFNGDLKETPVPLVETSTGSLSQGPPISYTADIQAGLIGTATVKHVVQGMVGGGSTPITVPGSTRERDEWPVVFFPGGGATENWNGESVASKTAWRAYVPPVWTGILACIASYSPTFAPGQLVPGWAMSVSAGGETVRQGVDEKGEPTYTTYSTYRTQGWVPGRTDDRYPLGGLMNGINNSTQVSFINRTTPGDVMTPGGVVHLDGNIYVRIRLGGKPGVLPPYVLNAVDPASMARYGTRPLEMENPYKPSDQIAQQVVARELARRRDPTAINITVETDGMPLRALDYVYLTDTTVPGITVSRTHVVLSNEWSINEQGLKSTLRFAAAI